MAVVSELERGSGWGQRRLIRGRYRSAARLSGARLNRDLWLGMVLSVGAAAAQAELPLWEVGVGVGAVRVPDYPGAAHRSNYVIPTPVAVYRGRYLRSDRDGVRGVLLDTDLVELDLSAGLTPAANSADNPRRTGMDNLRPTLELGPKLTYAAWRGDAGRWRWDWELPVRASVTLERSSRYAGAVVAPEMRFQRRDLWQVPQWDVTLHVNGEWADHRYLRRTLGVRSDEATDTRAAFYPSGGFAGSQWGLRMERRVGPVYVGAGVTRHFLRGAQAVHSPLVETRATTRHWMFVSWMFARSEASARGGEDR